MRRGRGPGLAKWLIGGAVLGVVAYLLRRRGRIFVAALSGALTDRALRALADTFREEESPPDRQARA